MNDNVITTEPITELLKNNYDYYNEEDLDFTLDESFLLLKNELTRVEKKIIVTELTIKYNSVPNRLGYWVDEEYLEILNTDLLYYKEKYGYVKTAILNLLNKMKETQYNEDGTLKINSIEEGAKVNDEEDGEFDDDEEDGDDEEEGDEVNDEESDNFDDDEEDGDEESDDEEESNEKVSEGKNKQATSPNVPPISNKTIIEKFITYFSGI